jgi:hypothetical protein
MGSKYLDPRKRGRNYEQRLAQEGRGKMQPGSGNRWDAKNDLKDEKMLIEAKSTDAEVMYGLKKADLLNVIRRASLSGRVGAMFLDFSGDEFVIVAKRDFDRHWDTPPAEPEEFTEQPL